MQADDWPSHAEELGRKSLATLEMWMRACDTGEISQRELCILVSGIYDTISGLAPRRDLDVIAAVYEGIRQDGQ